MPEKAKRRPHHEDAAPTTNGLNSKPDCFVFDDIEDPFATERLELAAVIAARAAWLAALGLVPPERFSLEEIRRIAGFDRLVQRTRREAA